MNNQSQTTDAASALATKIQAKVETTLKPLEREMVIMKWAPEFRKIIWEAVARHALNEAANAE